MRKKQRSLWFGGIIVGLILLTVFLQAGEKVGELYNSVTSLLGMFPVTADTQNGGSSSGSANHANGKHGGSKKDGGGEKEDRRLTPLPVAGIKIEPATFTLTVRGTGRAEAYQRAELSPRVGEKIHRIHVHEGQFVKSGNMLVELDPRPYQMSLKEAEANCVKAQLEFEAQLFNDDSASEEKRLRIAHRTGLTEAEQRLARAELNLSGTSITAPFDGYIASIVGTMGERAQADRPIITILDNHKIKIPAEILESDFGTLQTGVAATIRFPALPGEEFKGTVSALSPEVNPERGTGIAYIELPNPDGRIKPGMYAGVDVEAAHFPGRLAVPRPAVIERDRRLLVFVAHNGRAEWSYVKTGLETDDSIEITSGVAPGDTVLVDGHLTLAHGAPIKVALAGK